MRTTLLWPIFFLLLTAPLHAVEKPQGISKFKTEVRVELENGPATLADLPQTTPDTDAFIAQLKGLSHGSIQLEQSRTGVSQHFVVRDVTGKRLGVFRTVSAGGAIEAEVMLMDPDHFFNLAPAIKVVIKQGKKKVEGYLQQFEGSQPGKVPRPDSSFVQQIQKIGILDILLADEDRATGNIVIREGILVPIDHNNTLLTVDADHFGLDITKRLIEPPFWRRAYPRAANRPVWLNRLQFLSWAQKPWTVDSIAFVKNWDAKHVAQDLKQKFAVSEGAIGLMISLDTWLKKGVEAGLTLEQIGAPIYNTKGIFQDVFHLARTARLEDALEYAGVEYDLLQAVELTRQQLLNKSADDRSLSHIQTMFAANLNTLYDRRIALIKNALNADQVDEYYSEVWLNLLFQDEIHEWLRTHQEIPKEKLRMMPCSRTKRQAPDLEVETPLPCVVDALQLAKKLTAARLERDSTSVAAALREDLHQAFLVHFYYVSSLLGAKPGTEEYLRMAQFLRVQIERSNELLIPGVVWNADQNLQMSKMNLSDVIMALSLARKRALQEGEYYKERLGTPWIAFAAPKYVGDYLDRFQQLRRQLEKGQIDQAQFNDLSTQM